MKSENIVNNMDNKLHKYLELWADEGKLPAEKSQQLEDNIQRLAQNERKRHWRWAGGGLTAAAVCCLALFLIYPTIPGWALENIPLIGKYISRQAVYHQGWKWAEEKQMFQEVLASCTDKGYTVKIHRVLADTTSTTLFYTIEGDNHSLNSDCCHLSNYRVYFNDQDFNVGGGGSSEIIDGAAAGSLSLDQGIPEESGTMRLIIDAIGEINGKWELSFPVNRKALSDLSQEIAINQKFNLPEGEFSIDRLVLAPTQTIIEISSKGILVRPECDIIGVAGPLRKLGGHSTGYNYTMQFDRLDPVPAEVKIKLQPFIFKEIETQIPLEIGTTKTIADGYSIKIEELEQDGKQGRLVISYRLSEEIKNGIGKHPFDRWWIIDDKGNRHHSGSHSTCSYSDVQVRETLHWEMPADRTAAALYLAGYWELYQIPVLEIKIPPR